MTWWWLADFVLVVVVLPVVVAILIQVLIPIFQIKQYANDIIAAAGTFPEHLDDIAEELVKTRDLVTVAGPEIGRYARAIDNL